MRVARNYFGISVALKIPRTRGVISNNTEFLLDISGVPVISRAIASVGNHRSGLSPGTSIIRDLQRIRLWRKKRKIRNNLLCEPIGGPCRRTCLRCRSIVRFLPLVLAFRDSVPCKIATFRPCARNRAGGAITRFVLRVCIFSRNSFSIDDLIAYLSRFIIFASVFLQRAIICYVLAIRNDAA